MSAQSEVSPHRVLIGCYHYPPDASVGALRPARFARLLPTFGWQPYVLTVSNGSVNGTDPERLRGLEHVTVVRTREVPIIKKGLLRLRRVVGHDVADRPRELDTTRRGDRERFGQRMIRYVVSLAVFMPDEQKEWALAAAWRAVKLIRKQRIACVMTSSPPASVHVIGLVSRLFTKAKWVADFRDPWIDCLDARPPQARSKAADTIEGLMERAVLRFADKVITTTERFKRELEGRYAAVVADKVVCVPNAIESRPFGRDESEKYGPLTITYAGTLYEGRSPEPLFRALEELISSKKLGPTEVRIKLIGHCHSIDGQRTQAVADRYGLGSVVEVLDFLPYSEVRRVMRKSHLLLVLAPAHHRLIVPAKVYDYLAVEGDILALAESGATTDIVAETGSGRCFAPSDIDGIKRYLLECVRGVAPKNNRSPNALASYGEAYLTGRLAGELSALLPS